MSKQTRAMFVFQAIVIILVACIGILAVAIPDPGIKGLLAGADVGVVIVDVVGIALYARYVHRGQP